MTVHNNLLTPDQFREQFAGLVQDISNKAKAEQRRAAWLDQKRGKFGASSTSCFWTPSRMTEADNASTRKYIAEKAAELDGSLPPEISARALSWGNDEEAPGMVDLMDRTGLTVTHYGDEQKWFEWSECDQIGATPDGIIVDGTGQRIPVEQKNPITGAEHARMIAHIQTGADLRTVEFKYWVQVQQQIMVLDAPFGLFFTRDKRRESVAAQLAWWIVPRDDGFITMHGDRLKRAVQERDELIAAQAGREWVDLSFLK